MLFNEAVERKGKYTSLTECKTNPIRETFLNENQDKLDLLSMMLFDHFNIEECYIVGDFLDKGKYTVENMTIHIPIDDLYAEDFFDQEFLGGFKFKFLIEMNTQLYLLHENQITLQDNYELDDRIVLRGSGEKSKIYNLSS